MYNNNLKNTLEKEGINQIDLVVPSGIAHGTINKICNYKYDPSPTSKSKILKGLNKLTEKVYKLEDIFLNSN